MDCSDYKDEFVRLLKGHLGEEDSQRLRSHLEECGNCRREYEETDWLVAGMVDASARIKGGHISSRLLCEYVQLPASLDSDTIDFIAAHIDRCDHCRQDAKVIERLSAINLDANDGAIDASRGSVGAWRSLFRRRLLPAYATVVLAAVVIALLFALDRTPSLLVARAVSPVDAEQSGHTVVALANSMAVRGDHTSGVPAPPVISKSDWAPVVLSIEVVTFEDEDMRYSARIEKAEGEAIWETDLDPALLESGRLWLLFDQVDLSTGTYRVSVIENEGLYEATISTATIEIVE